MWQLFQFPLCPFSRKVRLVLAEKGAPSAASELARFATTPRAIQAMMRGTGAKVGHFKPSVHVTLWS